MTIYRGPGGTGSATSDADTTLYQDVLNQAKAAKDAAAVSATAAAGSASSASTSATNAANSASSASTSASSAATSATNAASSATAAASSATAAAASAASINPADIVHISGTETITGAKTFSQTITGSITGNAGTATNGVVTTGSYADPTWITSLAGSKVSGNISGNAGNVTGTVAVTNGGTGSTTASAARTALGVAIGTDVQAYSPNLSAYASTGIGFRNRIINGEMRIDQRNNGASVTATTGLGYTLDRWAVFYSQLSKYTIQRNAGGVTPPSGFSNYLGITSLSAYAVTSTDYNFINQSIEGFNASDVGWGAAGAQTVTLSFWVRSSLTGTFSGSVRSGSGTTRSYVFAYTINSANTWEFKTVTIAGDTSGTWATDNTKWGSVTFCLGSGSTRLGTAGSWQTADLDGVTGTTSVVGTNAATFYITGVQLEAGSVATPFERRDYGRELMMCQRYYETGFLRVDTYGGAGGTISMMAYYKVTKRAAPTVTYSATGYSNASGIIVDSGSDASGFESQATVTATGGAAYTTSWQSASEL